MQVTTFKDDNTRSININTKISDHYLIDFGKAVFDEAVKMSAQKFAEIYLAEFLDDCLNSKHEIIEIAKKRAGEILAEAFLEHYRGMSDEK